MNKPHIWKTGNGHFRTSATKWRGKLALALIVLVALSSSPAQPQQNQGFFPKFRHQDLGNSTHGSKPTKKLLLLSDQDFAPWSFQANDAAMKGISVELALSACADIGIECEIRPLAYDKLMQTFLGGEGDLVISGLRINENIADGAALTRPYFVSLGRFAARLGSPIAGPDVRSLAGKRLGYVKNSSHGAFLEKYYSRSSLLPFDKVDMMLEALRTGSVDAAFGDSLAISYWVSGSLSRNCCAALGKAFVDHNTFSRNLVFLARRDDRNLRDVFDASLDHLEEQGATEKIFTSYLPAPIW